MSHSTAGTKVKITLDEAIQKTIYWRKFLASLLHEHHSRLITKGVYISKEDIEDLAKMCFENDSIMGVRAYFTLEHDHESWPYDNTVKFIMVPVEKEPHSKNGKDIPVRLLGDANSLEDSNIYDFTMPCPDSCDPSSPLYGVPVK
jgi:lipopolysaccharide biosynthesis glycosyltransferase